MLRSIGKQSGEHNETNYDEKSLYKSVDQIKYTLKNA